MDTLYIPVFSVGRGKLVPDFQDKVSAENQTQMLGWQPTPGPVVSWSRCRLLTKICLFLETAGMVSDLEKTNIPEIRRARAIENLVMN